MKRSAIKRRDFLKTFFATAAGMVLMRLRTAQARKAGAGQDVRVFFPLAMRVHHRVAIPGKVIHIYAPSVTNWAFDYSKYYGKTQSSTTKGVNQSVVDAMVDRGVTELLGMPPSAVAEAWSQLIPNYSPGKVVAIKINLNNSFSCDTTTTSVDAIAQPINAVVRGLKMRGVRDQDIVVYDAIRYFPNRVYQELIYKDIQIHDSGCRGHPSTWSSNDLNAMVQFYPPSGSPPSVRLSDTLIQADYLINMPILKGHPLAGVTLGFKNHFGSTNNPGGMHTYVSTSYELIEQYDALVDLFSNPHIRDKTCLTIADGIYGSRQYQDTPPQPWNTFNLQSPCSLFFATDPVAVDCVMHDLLKAERGTNQPGTSNCYLRLAAEAGLGVFESGNPWQLPYGSGYSQINYRRIEM